MEVGKCPRCGSPAGVGAYGGMCPQCSTGGDSLAPTTSGDGDRQARPRPPGQAVGILREGQTGSDFPGTGSGFGAGSAFGAGPGSEAETTDTPPPSDDPMRLRPRAPRLPGAEGDGRAPGDDDRAFWSDLAPAPRIDGYDVLRRLKHGGQGVVYLAVQRSTKRKVAVKLLLQGVFASRSARRRFEREIELVASLKHPNIIAVFDSGTTPDRHSYCVMDYVRGVPLTQYVRDNALNLEQLLALIATTCEAVSHAHQRGVIHRDLKPSNIMVDVDGNVHVLDFGLAKTLTEPVETVMSVTGNVVGTYPYMSPEQTRGNPDEVDTRTDVYALGVMLYEALCGAYPYPVTGSVAEVIRHICETPPAPPVRAWSPDKGVPAGGRRGRGAGRRAARCPIDADLSTIVCKALAKERERRYDSAGQFARDLRRYLANEPIVARRPSAAYQVRVFARRHKAVAGASLAVVLVLLLSVAVLVQQLKRVREANVKANAETAKADAAAKWAEGERLRADETLVAMDQFMGYGGDERADEGDLIAARRLYVKALDEAREYGLSGSATLAGLLEIGSRPGGALPLMGSYGGASGAGGFRGHAAKPNNVAVLRRGRRALTSGGDGALILWDLVTGARVRSVRTPHGTVNYVAVSPDETWAVTAGEDGTVRRWQLDDLSGGDPLITFPPAGENDSGPERAWMVTVSDDGRRVLAGGAAGHVALWDEAGGQRMVGDCRESCAALAFLPRDGRFALSGDGSGNLRLWDLDTLKEAWDEPVAHVQDHGHGGDADPRNQVNCVAFSPDRRSVASVSFDGSLVVWNAQWDAGSGGPVLRLDRRFPAVEDRQDWLWRVAFSDDSRSVATAARSGRVRVFDAQSGAPLYEFRAQNGDVNGVAFLDARTLVSTGDGARDEFGKLVNSALMVWHLPGAAGVAGATVGGEITGLIVDDDGRVRISTTHGPVDRFVGRDGRLREEVDPASDPALSRVPAGSRQGMKVPSWTHALRSTPAPDPNRVGPTGGTTPERPRELASVPGGRAKLFAGAGATLQLWGAPKPGPDQPAGAMVAMRTFHGHRGRVVAAAVSRGGRYIVSADDHGTVLAWDLFRPLQGRDLARRMARAHERLKSDPDDKPALALLGEWYAFCGREMSEDERSRRTGAPGGAPPVAP